MSHPENAPPIVTPATDGLAWPTRVLIVDDAASTRRFIQAVLQDCPRFDVTGEAENGKTAVERARLLKPDLVLLDLSMPVLDGTSALDQILAEVPSATVIVLSGVDGQYVQPLLDAGAAGFVPKGLAPAELIEQIEAILARTGVAPAAAPPGAAITIPAVVERPQPTAPPQPPPPAAPAVEVRAVTCEDDAAMRRLVSQVLLSCEVVVAAETSSVPNLLSVLAVTSPDLIILDLWLEGTSGTEVIADISAAASNVPIIVFSGHEAWRGASLGAGASAFVAKPHFEELAEQIRRLAPQCRS